MGGLTAGLGCGEDPPPAPSAAELLATGQLDAAVQAAADTPLASTAARYAALTPERAQVQAAEGRMLRDAAAEALTAGDLAKGGRILGTARAALPDDPELAALEEALEEALVGAAPAARAAALLGLAEGSGDTPERQTALQAAASLAAVEARYGTDQVAGTRAGQVGITRAAAGRLLAMVDAEYHEVPNWPRAQEAARAALMAMARAEGARARWPRITDADLGTATSAGLAGAEANLDHAIATLGAAGVPEAVVVETWTRGALGALDPWSRAVWPAEIASWEAGHSGVIHGVGLELELDPAGVVRVSRPLPNTPAWTSGIHQGDRLDRVQSGSQNLRLDKVEAQQRLDAAQAALLGPTGTPLTLTVTPDGGSPTAIALVRGPVVTETVHGWTRGPDNAWDPYLNAEAGIVYVRILRFKPTTEAAFDDLVAPVLGSVEGVVLDLRGNPGGDVNSAVQIADRFVADGWLAELSGRVLPDTGPDVDPETGETLAAWNQAIPGHALEGVPIVVLVDGDTASSAELLAGALQERAHARVVGAPTWGKGRAQALRVDPEGGFAVQFTNVVWALPSGHRLAHGVAGGGGIQPNVQVTLGPAERFQVDRRARARAALRVHADGTPLTWDDPGRRDDMPPLTGDPVVVAGELVLRATLLETTASQTTGADPGQ
jgi:C-terminal peptidase prc